MIDGTATQIVLKAYHDARRIGHAPKAAAQLAWLAFRRSPSGSRARAPRWDEAVSLNTGRRRAYRCPLGSALGLTGDRIGQHCAEWPRTRRSLAECAEARDLVVGWLENGL
jgi:hypothetical protein